MAKKRSRSGEVSSSLRLLAATDLLHFIELNWFTADWNAFHLPAEELARLQVVIMCDPKSAPVVKETHGLRKMRFSPLSWPRGKSGALRVMYVYFEKYFTVLLAVVYDKTASDTLPKSAIAAINKAIDRIQIGLAERFREG